MLSPVLSGMFYQAIPLPKRDGRAKNILWLSLGLNVFFTVGLLLIWLLLKNYVETSNFMIPVYFVPIVLLGSFFYTFTEVMMNLN